MPWQRDAVPAYNGSLEHLKRLVTSLRGLQIAKDHSYLLIPVFYANLRTLHSIPVAEATLARESVDDIPGAIASMEGLVLSSGFAEGVLVEIWPRFWHSFQVVYNHRASVTTRSEKQILLALLVFLGLIYDDHGYSFDVVSEVPRLRSLSHGLGRYTYDKSTMLTERRMTVDLKLSPCSCGFPGPRMILRIRLTNSKSLATEPVGYLPFHGSLFDTSTFSLAEEKALSNASTESSRSCTG
jgi:hypothetical protein